LIKPQPGSLVPLTESPLTVPAARATRIKPGRASTRIAAALINLKDSAGMSDQSAHKTECTWQRGRLSAPSRPALAHHSPVMGPSPPLLLRASHGAIASPLRTGPSLGARRAQATRRSLNRLSARACSIAACVLRIGPAASSVASSVSGSSSAASARRSLRCFRASIIHPAAFAPAQLQPTDSVSEPDPSFERPARRRRTAQNAPPAEP
jgi:hypothetical protein